MVRVTTFRKKWARVKPELKRLVRAVAERGSGALLALAEPALAGFWCRPGQRRENAFGLVAAIAEGLAFGKAAAAPPIFLALFNLHRDGLFGSDMGFGHGLHLNM